MRERWKARAAKAGGYSGGQKVLAFDPVTLKTDTTVYANQYYARHRNRITAARYGLTEQQLSDLRDLQGNACAICQRELSGKVVVDHCHHTGQTRGLLCAGCNNSLGGFRDDPVMLLRACLYLTEGVERVRRLIDRKRASS